MVTIVPADKEETAARLHRAGLSESGAVMILRDGEEEHGFIVYTVVADCVELLFLQADEPLWEEWLIRAAMNAGVNRLAIDAVSRNPRLSEPLSRLGFTCHDGEWRCFMPEFFTRPCAGCHGEK